MNFVLEDLKGFWRYIILALKDTMLMNLFNDLDLSMQICFLATFLVVPLLCKAILGDYYVLVKWVRSLFNSYASFKFNYIDFDADLRAHCTKLMEKGK
jgi:hypothetical protein